MKINIIKILVVLIVALSFSKHVFGDVPVLTVVIGNRGYTLEQLEKEYVLKELNDDEEIFIKKVDGVWENARTKEIIPKESIPEVTIIDDKGVKSIYAHGDGELIVQEAEDILFILNKKKSNSGIGECIRLDYTPEGYKGFANVCMFKILDKQRRVISGFFRIEENNYIYPSLRSDEISLVLFDGSGEEITKVDSIDIDESKYKEKIFIGQKNLEGVKEYYVNNGEEFLKAIGPRRKIVLEEGNYDLDVIVDNKYVFSEYHGDDSIITISGVNGLTIEAKDGAKLVGKNGESGQIRLESSSDLKIKGLHFFKSSNLDKSNSALQLEDCDNVTIEEIKVTGEYSKGIDISNCINVKIEGCTIESTFTNIMNIKYSSGIELFNSVFQKNTGGQGIEIIESGDMVVDSCTFNENNYEAAGLFYYIANESDENSLLIIKKNIFSKNSSSDFVSNFYGKIKYENNSFYNNKFD